MKPISVHLDDPPMWTPWTVFPAVKILTTRHKCNGKSVDETNDVLSCSFGS
jgi:hypothetical protein